MAIVALALLKLLLYYGVCLQAPRMLQLAIPDRFAFALKWAAARLGLGILLAYPLFLVVAHAQSLGVPFAVAYVWTLLLARCSLWYGVSIAIRSRHGQSASTGAARWVGIGVAASFAVDGSAYLAGADNFKFVC